MIAFVAAPFAIAEEMDEGNTQLPPGLELIDESEHPTITIRRPDATSEITERREHGEVKEVRVHSGVSTYYLLPNNPLGSAFQDAGSRVVRPAMWRVHEFDMTGHRSEDAIPGGEDAPDYSADAPSPPPLPQ